MAWHCTCLLTCTHRCRRVLPCSRNTECNCITWLFDVQSCMCMRSYVGLDSCAGRKVLREDPADDALESLGARHPLPNVITEQVISKAAPHTVGLPAAAPRNDAGPANQRSSWPAFPPATSQPMPPLTDESASQRITKSEAVQIHAVRSIPREHSGVTAVQLMPPIAFDGTGGHTANDPAMAPHAAW